MPGKPVVFKDFAAQWPATQKWTFEYLKKTTGKWTCRSLETITDGFVKEYPFMFFGGQDAVVNLHYDIDCSSVFLTQFQTRKCVVLFAPDAPTWFVEHYPPFCDWQRHEQSVGADLETLERRKSKRAGVDAYITNRKPPKKQPSRKFKTFGKVSWPVNRANTEYYSIYKTPICTSVTLLAPFSKSIIT